MWVLSMPSRAHCVLIQVHVWTTAVQRRESRHDIRCQPTDALPAWRVIIPYHRLGSSPHVSVACETGLLKEPCLLSQSKPTAHSHQGPRCKNTSEHSLQAKESLPESFLRGSVLFLAGLLWRSSTQSSCPFPQLWDQMHSIWPLTRS